MKLIVKRLGNSLQASNNESFNELQTIDYDKDILIEVKLKRNAKNHARYFTFINTAFDMQHYYESKEVFRKMMQMRAGFFDEIISHKGKVAYIPRSIAWEELDELEFRKLFKDVITAFLSFYRETVGELSEEQFYKIIDFD